MLFIALAACSAAQDEAGAPRAARPERGGTIVFATDREPFSLDPAHGGDQPQSDIARSYLDSLVRQKTDGSFAPWLAESWEISQDGTIYRFHLRRDVVFTDGTRLDAAAVKANFDHWLDPKSVNAESGTSLRNIRSMAAPDRFTFVVDIGEPYADFLAMLASSYAGMQSPAGLRRGHLANGLAPIGTGPFIVAKWDKQSEVVLVRNPHYNSAPPDARHQGPAYAERLVWKFIPEGATRFAALRSNELDAIETVPPTRYRDAKAARNLTLIDGTRPGVPVQLDFNTRRPPFDNADVRRAFRHAVDVEQGLKTIYFGAYRGFGGALNPNTRFYDPALETAYRPDLAKAAALLDRAGWRGRDAAGYRTRDGRRLIVQIVLGLGATPQEYFLLDQIAGSARKAGFDVRYRKLDDNQAQDARAQWDYDLVKDYWGGTNTAAALFFLYHSAMTADIGHGYHPNGTGYVDPRIDQALKAAMQTHDGPGRQASYSEVQRVISDQALNLPLYLQPLQYLYRNDRVRGLAVDPATQQVSFHDAWVIRR